MEGALFRACAYGEGMRASWACPLLRAWTHNAPTQPRTRMRVHRHHVRMRMGGNGGQGRRGVSEGTERSPHHPQKQGCEHRFHLSGVSGPRSQIRRLRSVFDP